MRALILGCCVLGLTLAGGCAAPDRVPAVAAGPSAGGSWVAVLPAAVLGEEAGAGAAAAFPPELWAADPGWVLTRADDRLNPREVEPVLATSAWPEVERPSLLRPIFVRIYSQPHGFYHYRPAPWWTRRHPYDRWRY